MKEENNFVRHLRACETMGAATTILSDKTGTLTKNKMTVTKAFLFGKSFDLPNCEGLKHLDRHFVAENIARNTTAFLRTHENGKIEHIGNRTECALLQMIQNWGISYSEFRDAEKEEFQVPFTSQRKKMSTIYQDSKNITLYCKGAPESIL
mmetsp:Transcript_2965/g.394  ORF Transcript_2965/g.394 Transcript_2965/m.394 type:complete len:151 (-) Transcript_2965:1463-1915(-)